MYTGTVDPVATYALVYRLLSTEKMSAVSEKEVANKKITEKAAVDVPIKVRVN